MKSQQGIYNQWLHLLVRYLRINIIWTALSQKKRTQQKHTFLKRRNEIPSVFRKHVFIKNRIEFIHFFLLEPELLEPKLFFICFSTLDGMLKQRMGEKSHRKVLFEHEDFLRRFRNLMSQFSSSCSLYRHRHSNHKQHTLFWTVVSIWIKTVSAMC